MTKQVYIGASLGNMGARLQNEITKDKIIKAGLTPYLAQNNSEINDKRNAKQEGLAERIVEADFNKIDESDILLFDVLETTGTTAELSSVYGQKRLAKQLLNIIESESFTLDKLEGKLRQVLNKPVLFQCTDLRSQNTEFQQGFRREFGMNQLLYGVVLALSDGKGFIEQDDLQEELNKLGSK